MGLLGDLFDDVLSLPVKIVQVPVRVVAAVGCALDEHDWGPWRYSINCDVRVRRCNECGAEEER
jgi:hypothetical protein